MRTAVIALLSLAAFAGVGALAISLLPTADSEPLHSIEVTAPQLQPLPQAPTPQPSTPVPAGPPPPTGGPPPPPAPAPPTAPRTQANLRDIPPPPPPLVNGDDGDDDWDDDWDDGDQDDDWDDDDD